MWRVHKTFRFRDLTQKKYHKFKVWCRVRRLFRFEANDKRTRNFFASMRKNKYFFACFRIDTKPRNLKL